MYRIIKKSLLLILSAAILFSVQAPTAVKASDAAQTVASMPPYFTDVTVNSWYFDEVMDVTNSGYMEGVGNSQFSPQTTMTRAMVITILGRIAKVDTTKYSASDSFSDVPKNTWYTPYVSWAVKYGITKGTTEESFSPNQPVTREQMVTFFARYVQYADLSLVAEPISTTTFHDQDIISAYALESVKLMHSAGIIEGDDTGNFHPTATATRAEAAAIISRFANAYGISAEKIPYPDMRYIIHGGGSIGEYATTNAKEALENAYSKGNRTIEIDFNFTSDGHLICIHDLNYKVIPNTPNYKEITLEEFLNCRIYGEFTPMDLRGLAEYMRAHPDLYIVTDIKQNNIDAVKLLSEQYPDLKNQFIIQIYTTSEYEPVHNLGFPYIIYTLYRTSWNNIIDPNYLLDFAESSDLLGFSVSDSLLSNSNIVSNLRQTGLPIYTHTVNSADQIETYFDMGLYGVYTDNTIHAN